MLWYIAYNQKYWPVSEEDRGLIALPLFHKNALRGTVKPMLYAGGSFVIMPDYERRRISKFLLRIGVLSLAAWPQYSHCFAAYGLSKDT